MADAVIMGTAHLTQNRMHMNVNFLYFFHNDVASVSFQKSKYACQTGWQNHYTPNLL